MINQAIEFATLSHQTQTRKGTEIPYILHCLEAGIIAANMTTKGGQVDSDVVCAAILHDTIEDTDVSYQTLKQEFNENIANLVKHQSEDKSKEWLERKLATIKFLQLNQSKAVEIATLADKLSNMRSIFRDYQVENEKLWDKFNAAKEEQHWYYESIGDSLSQVKDTNEYREYIDLIKKTFEK